MLFICGDKLIKNYKKSYLEVLNYLLNTWVVEFEKYVDVDNASGAISEVQNRGFGIDIAGKKKAEKEEATGIKLALTFKRRVLEIAQAQINKCNDPTYQGEGRFKNQIGYWEKQIQIRKLRKSIKK